MTLDEAVEFIRTQPGYGELVRNAYLGADVLDSSRRFQDSAEFKAVRRLIGEDRLVGAVVVDLGAGTGIAAKSFTSCGARRVIAVEPDPSDLVGQGAIRRLVETSPIEIVSAFGEAIPLGDATADVVYARQVLHHTRDLAAVLRECARVLRPGGVFIACREHVVDDEAQLAAFLRNHPMHQLSGGENAYSLEAYLAAIDGSGMIREAVLGPWDSVINAFPNVQSEAEMAAYPRTLLRERLGALGGAVASVPGVTALVWQRLKRPVPGRLYTFVARTLG
jgi:SAM-dependent methyltransferase